MQESDTSGNVLFQVDNDTGSCTSAKTGRIRYDGATTWEYCNGSAWVPFERAASGGCTAPTLCPNVGDVCDDGNAGTINDPLFAGFMVYNDTNSPFHQVCVPLFVTNNNQSSSVLWKTSTGANDLPINSHSDGSVNDAQIPDSTTFPAFKLCKDLTDGGFTDWYLPARQEMDLLWLNSAAINANAAANFNTTDSYWTSSQFSNNQAWAVHFDAAFFGQPHFPTKTQLLDVRCVRKSDPCADSPVPGMTCGNGTVYVGLSPDGNVPMFTTPAEQGGNYWGTNGFVTGSTSSVTGAANSADIYAHVLAGDGTSNPDDGFPNNAFVTCETLSAYGNSDWYVPSESELALLISVKDEGDLDGTFTLPSYYTSKEVNNNVARAIRTSDGAFLGQQKFSQVGLRCVRKQP
jgi:hypothetical protein